MNKEGTIKVIFIVKEALQIILSLSFCIPKYLRSSSKPDGQWSSRVKYCGVVSFLCYPLQILSLKKVTSVEYAVKKNMVVFTQNIYQPWQLANIVGTGLKGYLFTNEILEKMISIKLIFLYHLVLLQNITLKFTTSHRRALSTTATRWVDDLTVKQVEPRDARKSLLSAEELEHQKALSGYITIDTPVSICLDIKLLKKIICVCVCRMSASPKFQIHLHVFTCTFLRIYTQL